MIERRVGLLFACFLLLFVIAIGRAAWVQGIQGGGLAADAQSQQTQTVTIPGRRGRILDRHGRELAVSEDAADVIATPYQVEDPARAARRLAPLLNVSEAELLRLLADRSSGFAYLARQVGLPVADRVRKLKLAGIACGAVEPAGLPGGQARGSRDRDRGGRRRGPRRARGGRRRSARRRQRGAPGGAGRARQRDRARHAERGRAGGGPATDDRRGDPGADRGGPRRRRPDVPAEARHGDRDGPAQRRGLGHGRLAKLRSQRSGLGLAGGPAEHGHGLHL